MSTKKFPPLNFEDEIVRELSPLIGEDHLFSDDRFVRTWNWTYSAPVTEIFDKDFLDNLAEALRKLLPEETQKKVNLYGEPCSNAGFEHKEIRLFVSSEQYRNKRELGFYAAILDSDYDANIDKIIKVYQGECFYVQTPYPHDRIDTVPYSHVHINTAKTYIDVKYKNTDKGKKLMNPSGILSNAETTITNVISELKNNFEFVIKDLAKNLKYQDFPETQEFNHSHDLRKYIKTLAEYYKYQLYAQALFPSFFPKEIYETDEM